jgi:hypothetical protein
MGEIEQGLGMPTGDPATVAALVAAMPSVTMQANRTLTPLLLRRLQDVAALHDGRVPIYGRLFAQWMHHAYPRECPFPHLSGTTSPQHVEDFAATVTASGGSLSVTAPEEEMSKHITAKRMVPAALQGSLVETPLESAQWTLQEELYVPLAPDEAIPPGQAAIHVVVGLVTLATLFLGLGRSVRSAIRACRRSAEHAGGDKGDVTKQPAAASRDGPQSHSTAKGADFMLV